MQPAPRHRRRRRPSVWIIAVVAVLGLATPIHAAAARADDGSHAPTTKPTIVLVHGDWADGSGWNAVTKRLIDHGYTVVVPPNPLRGPIEDSAYIRSYLQTIPGPIVLAAHSYGGFVITNAATGLGNVKALVYIDAFIPDEGDTEFALVPGSCLGVVPEKVFESVPVAGGVDFYLQIAPVPPYTGLAECFANGVDRRTYRAARRRATTRPTATSSARRPGRPLGRRCRRGRSSGPRGRVVPLDQQQVHVRSVHSRRSTTVKAGRLSLVSHPRGSRPEIVEAAVAATS